MNLATKYLGEVEIEEKDIINFEEGLPGFPDERRFFIASPGKKYPFCFLQSASEKNLCFLIISPFMYFTDYDIDLPDQWLQRLDITSPSDMQLWSILNLKDSLDKATVNLQAPIVVNTAKGKAGQVILNNPRYSIRHPLKQPRSQENINQEGGEKNAGADKEAK